MRKNLCLLLWEKLAAKLPKLIPFLVNYNQIVHKFVRKGCTFFLHWCFTTILNKYWLSQFYEYLFFGRNIFQEHLQWWFKTIVGSCFALILIYPVTIPINWKWILTVVTFHLHKRVLRHQANNKFHTYFPNDKVCKNLSENRRK